MNRHPKRYKVLHAPYDVGGNSFWLAKAESSFGFESKTLVYYKQWFGYPSDKNLKMKPGSDPLLHASWWLAMLKIARSCDALHFNFGSSFLNDVGRGRIFMDLPFWKRLGIATFVSFQGCDSRICEYCLSNFSLNACKYCRSNPFCLETYDNFKKECLSQVGRYFDGVFAVNPDLMHHIPGACFLPYSNCDIDSWRPPQGFDWYHQDPVRILHAPTWREIKGTSFVEKAIDDLRNEGENVELVVIEKVPHDEVRTIYESVDILVDQLHVGWYGGLAVELMALGKPVVAYIRHSDLKFLPPVMRDELPIVSADQHTLKESLRPLIRKTELRKTLGERSRRFAENWHHPKVVAEMTTSAYQEAIENIRKKDVKPKNFRLLFRSSLPTVKSFFSMYLRLWNFPFYCQKIVNRSFPLIFFIFLPLIRFRSFFRMHLGRPASVWGTTPIVTIPLLSRSDRLLGFKSHTIVYTVYYITKTFDYVMRKQIDWIADKVPYLLNAYYRFVFLRALLRYDVFHFFYDQGFLEREGRFGVNPEELLWLKKARKKVYLYAYGADVRTKKATLQMGKYNCCLHCEPAGLHCICNDAEGLEKQAFFSENATAVISMGDMMQYVPGSKNVHYWPIDIDKIPFIGSNYDGKRPLKILHVPNHEWAKGTKYLRETLERLAANGFEFEYIQVLGKPNTEILRLMGEADIIADQFLVGWLGYTALEAMAMGKIVLCYIRDRKMLLGENECPIISTNPDNLESVLSDIMSWDSSQFEKQGIRARAYVEKYYSLSAVALRMADMYTQTAEFPSRINKRIHRHAAKISGGLSPNA